jgi:hypothetical protein
MNAATNAEADSAGRPPPAVRLALTSDEDPSVSLRDLFAGLAMAGIWASGRRDTDGQGQPAQIAFIAYATADAMLTRRRR